MPLKNYTNNNEKGVTNSTFSSISFSNPGSKIMPSKFSISYFNRLMKISIALRNNAGSNDTYATYDTDNQVSVFVSNIKAKMLQLMIQKMINGEANNICIELKNGLLKISNGEEYGAKNPCISISYADENKNVNEIIYETKSEFHTAAYNYMNDKYSTETFNMIELDSISMALDEYYKASSYAIAASVMEASMYKRQGQYDLIKSIADAVGVAKNTNSKSFNNKTFLSGNNTKVNTPKEYETTTFESIAENM